MSTFKKGLLLGVMLIAATLTAQGAFYKWVDANGVTQYTQSPPPSGQYQEMHSSALPASDPASELQREETTAKDQNAPDTAAENPAQDDQKQAAQQAAREQNCQLARQRLAQLETHGRIRYQADDGSIQVMSEEEKQAKLAETRKMMADMCH